MSQPFRTVATGLRWVFVGCWLTPVAVVGVPCCGCLGGGLAGTPGSSPWLATAVLTSLPLLATLIAPVGRLMCLATPPDAPVARARIRLAVIFEVCSILSGISGIVITVADLLPGPFLGAGMLFTLLTGVIARVFFLLFTRSIAEHVGATDEAVTAKTILHAAIGLIVAEVLSVGGFALAESVTRSPDPNVLRAVLLILAAGVSCFGVMCLMYLGVGYLMLFSTLWRKVAQFAESVADHDDDESSEVVDDAPPAQCDTPPPLDGPTDAP